MQNAQFVFFGTPRFAEIFLSEILKRGFIPSLVICNPDRPAGRKKILTSPPVKALAEKHGIPVLQPENKNELETLNLKLETSFGLVAAYGEIIPTSVIQKFPKGIIGVHPSLLPEFRGATPIQAVLLERKEKTGISLFLLDEKVDHGPTIAQKNVAIGESDDYLSLEKKLALAGADLFVEKIGGYLSGEIKPTLQDESQATYTKKFSREDAFVPEDGLKNALDGRGAEGVCAKIRAFSAEPGAWTIQNGKQVKLLKCEIAGGKLVLKKIQPEGKKPQTL